MKQRLSITVRGKQHEWTFHFDGDPKYLAEWREDGLIIDEVVNSIPDWIAGTVLMRPWIFFQDIFNFRNPFRA